MEDVSEEYEKLSNEVRTAIQDEYFTKNGRLALNTQTALIVALFMELVPEEFTERIANDLRAKLKNDKNHLKTGFVGTPYLCRVLSENASNDVAYTLLLNKDYPSWLYAVTMGATTIWERWNSVLPDGKISGTDMNSLNHYAYGSIVEWMYRTMAGINPVENQPVFRHINLTPQPNSRINQVKASFQSAAGLYESQWSINEEGNLHFAFTIPFNTTATLVLPDAALQTVMINGQLLVDSGLSGKQVHESVQVELESGVWEVSYAPTKAYIESYTTEYALSELLSNEEAKSILVAKVPQISKLPEEMIGKVGHLALREVANKPFLPIPSEVLDELDGMLAKVQVRFE
jgi:alpha-L-rhamnosidase